MVHRHLSRQYFHAKARYYRGNHLEDKTALDGEYRACSRNKGPFITVNCSGFPPGLIESELFGHVKGAFTGAEREKKGVIELADKGTLLLDEIGDMPRELQGRLLRVLEDQKVRKVGGQKDIPVDFRVISATNRDLEDLIKKEQFRQDLFFRLNIMHIPLPALRGREEDIEESEVEGCEFLRKYLKSLKLINSRAMCGN